MTEIGNTGRRIRERIQESDKILVGIGSEWKKSADSRIGLAYEALNRLIGEKDYFIVTTVTDAEIFRSSLKPDRITAPCGNETWRQCSKSCTKDIWEPNEVPEDICPHCQAPLIGNTIEAEEYIEEGYLPQWKAYTAWLTGTLNKRLTVLELGEGFLRPTVIRWPFEKTVYLNQKAYLYRIHHEFAQITEELKGKAEGILANSPEFLRNI